MKKPRSISDKERLDFLDYEGAVIMMRGEKTEVGYSHLRLYDHEGGITKDLRRAIDAAIRAGRSRGRRA